MVLFLTAAEKAMPAACFLQDVMQPETMELDTFENVKQGILSFLNVYRYGYG